MERRPEPIDEKRGLDQHGVGIKARELVGSVIRNRKKRGRLVVGKRHEDIDGGRPKFGQGPAALNLAAEHRLAEILEHDEAAVEIESMDRRRGETSLFERACDRDERRNVLGEMNMRAVRL